MEREFEGILDRVAGELQAAGKLRDTHAGKPFGERFIAVAAESGEPIVKQFEIALATTTVDPEARSTAARPPSTSCAARASSTSSRA